MATYLLFLLLRPIATYLPRAALSVLATIAGAVAYAAARGPRDAVLRNLAIVAPDRSLGARRRLALRTFIHGALGYVELLGVGRINARDIMASYPLAGLENLEAALREGRGVILVGAHVGPISVAGQLLAAHAIPTTVVVEPLNPPQLHDLVASLRRSFGLQIVELGSTTIREVLAALRRGEVVGFVADRDVAGSGEPLPFFGRTTRMTTGPATLARRTGAIVLTCVAYRSGLWQGRAIIDGPVEIPRTAEVAADVRQGTLAIIARLERYVRAAPEQWVVFSDNWPSAGA